MRNQQQSVRDQAKQAAIDLLIIHGYNGFSFGMLSQAIETTRANLHYHFKTKQTLVEEVIEEYSADTAERFASIWLDRNLDFNEKVGSTFGFNEERYRKYNDESNYGRPWSLIARMKHDQQALGSRAVALLRSFSKTLYRNVTQGVRLCVESGSLRLDTPVDDVALQVTSVILSAGPITQDAGNIDTLKKLYRALGTTVMTAYGGKGDGRTDWK